LIACFLFIRYAIASFDSHYPGQKSSTQANTRVCFIELYTNTYWAQTWVSALHEPHQTVAA